jgi:hypothetical protein
MPLRHKSFDKNKYRYPVEGIELLEPHTCSDVLCTETALLCDFHKAEFYLPLREEKEEKNTQIKEKEV